MRKVHRQFCDRPVSSKVQRTISFTFKCIRDESVHAFVISVDFSVMTWQTLCNECPIQQEAFMTCTTYFYIVKLVYFYIVQSTLPVSSIYFPVTVEVSWCWNFAGSEASWLSDTVAGFYDLYNTPMLLYYDIGTLFFRVARWDASSQRFPHVPSTRYLCLHVQVHFESSLIIMQRENVTFSTPPLWYWNAIFCA